MRGLAPPLEHSLSSFHRDSLPERLFTDPLPPPRPKQEKLSFTLGWLTSSTLEFLSFPQKEREEEGLEGRAKAKVSTGESPQTQLTFPGALIGSRAEYICVGLT